MAHQLGHGMFGQRFELAGELGRGGFATVYRATDTTDGRQVALKVLHATDDSGYDADVRARFAREVEIVGGLRDPHTVRLVANGEDDGLLWAAFELVQGTDLAELLADRGRLDASTTRDLLLQVLESLKEAHARGLIHRDLKPDNVRVTAQGSRQVAKVLDFGIARSSEAGHPSVTKTGELIGTPRYMSPEQLKGKRLTAASDIYAVGLIGYELLEVPPKSPTMRVGAVVGPPNARSPSRSVRWKTSTQCSRSTRAAGPSY